MLGFSHWLVGPSDRNNLKSDALLAMPPVATAGLGILQVRTVRAASYLLAHSNRQTRNDSLDALLEKLAGEIRLVVKTSKATAETPRTKNIFLHKSGTN